MPQHRTSPRVGVLGLGRMGGPIAQRLAEQFPTTVYDPMPDRVLAITGAVAAHDPAALAAGSDIVVTVLPGPQEVRRSLVDGGALAALPTGSLWLDLSSNDPRVANALADAATARGVNAAAAPMSGGPAEARRGELKFFVGAAAETREITLEILAPLGAPFLPFAGGRPGDAHLVKLLANGLWFGQVVAVTEALLLGRAHGLEPETVRSILAQSAGGSAFLIEHASRMIAGDDLTDFGLDRVVEELDALEALASDAGTPHALQSIVASIHREALEAFGAVDGELLAARLLEKRSALPLESTG